MDRPPHSFARRTFWHHIDTTHKVAKKEDTVAAIKRIGNQEEELQQCRFGSLTWHRTLYKVSYHFWAFSSFLCSVDL